MRAAGFLVVLLFAAVAMWFDVAVVHEGDWRCAMNERCVTVRDYRP